MATERTITELQGVICAANDRGLKLQGETEWRNLSKWAQVAAIPPIGAAVVLGLDRSGYIREITMAEMSAKVSNGAAPSHSPMEESAPACRPDKDVAIARMNALGHAVALLTVRCGAPDVDDVLALAERLERWVLR